MTYIALNDVERNIWRVTERTAIEGRLVPAEDVRRRYERSFRNLGSVADKLDALHVFDNSGTDFEHVHLTLERGHILMRAESVPAWAERALGNLLARSRGINLSSLPVYAPAPHEIVECREDLRVVIEQSMRILGRSANGERVFGRCGGGILSVARAVFAESPSVDDIVTLSRKNGHGVARPQGHDHGLER